MLPFLLDFPKSQLHDMRTIEETRKRWEILFADNETPADLRTALRAEQGGKLCNDGLRSICWKVFLLFDGLEREEWSQKLAESREAYQALRAHFLKFIEHPDDVESTGDPLADDEESPWQTIRNDEKLQAEIAQDVDRCMQENLFFQDPATKKKLTDILFVYSKLNPDVGYRQGMHELVAPILWVIDRDSIQLDSEWSTGNKGDASMLDLLNPKFVEHDSFTLFLCVMQTARIYYEHSETRSANGEIDVIPIVNRCQYLHNEALTIIDHELAEHLHTVDVLPQIFLTRWMRLLFGREFPFDDVLMMWDLLFAHGLRSDLVDFTCIAMLLRIRWQLLKADYSGALSMLLRYPPPEPHTPQSFVHDALYLEQNPTADRGRYIISKYSGREPESKRPSQSRTRPARAAHLWEEFRNRSSSNSSTSSPTRNGPKGLETLLQDVSQGIQRRTEAWGVAKAVRGAVTEARRNMQTMQYEPGPRTGPSLRRPSSTLVPNAMPKGPTPTELGLEKKISLLEERNKELASALGEALDDLRSKLIVTKGLDLDGNDAVKQALAIAESVRGCLEDSSLSLPVASTPQTSKVVGETVDSAPSSPSPSPSPSPSRTPPPLPPISSAANPSEDVAQMDLQSTSQARPDATGRTDGGTTGVVSTATDSKNLDGQADKTQPNLIRPSLSDAGFSWMLEGSRNLSTFVSSASVPPEQTRHPEPPRSKGRGSPLFGNGGEENPRGEAEHDELALHSLRGARGPL